MTTDVDFLINDLSKDGNWIVRSNAADNPNTPAESLAELAKDRNWIVRSCAASNPNTPKKQLKRNKLIN